MNDQLTTLSSMLLQLNDPLAMFSGDMMTVNVNLSGLPVRGTRNMARNVVA
jgi:hypothetical protein